MTNEEMDKLLCETYPAMFKERHYPMDRTCMCWGFSCGPGWYTILDTLCASIEHRVKWKRDERAKAIRFNRALKTALLTSNLIPLYKYHSANPDDWTAAWHKEYVAEDLERKPFIDLEDYPAIQKVVVSQVKEKFGTLRFYYSGGDDVVDGMVRMSEAMSGCICEECGDAGTRSSNRGYISTKCEKHAK